MRTYIPLLLTASLACAAAGCALDDAGDDSEAALPTGDELERRSAEAMDQLGMPGEVKIEPETLPYYYNPSGCYYCSSLRDYADSWCSVVFGYNFVATQVDCYHDQCYHFGHIRWDCGRAYPSAVPTRPADGARQAQDDLAVAPREVD